MVSCSGEDNERDLRAQEYYIKNDGAFDWKSNVDGFDSRILHIREEFIL